MFVEEGLAGLVCLIGLEAEGMRVDVVENVEWS